MAGNKKSLDFEVHVNQSAATVWNAMASVNLHRDLLVPEIFASIEGGPWNQKGATRIVKYADGQPDSKYTLQMFNDAEFAQRITCVQEGMSSRNHSVSIKIMQEPNSESCVVHYSVEYEGAGEEGFFGTLKESYIRHVDIFNSRAQPYLHTLERCMTEAQAA